jgi:NADH-quinone oxidoreductase subunit J
LFKKVAQLVERWPEKSEVDGSNLSFSKLVNFIFLIFNRFSIEMDIFSLILPFTLFTSIVMVFLSKNPVYGVLAFVLVVLHSVIMLILLDLEFLAYILAIVYIGAIVVLFLFVIMMFYIYNFNTKRSLLRGIAEYYILGWAVSNSAYYLAYTDRTEYGDLMDFIYSNNLLVYLARYLFNEAIFFTVLAALIMLIGIIGAITLTVRSSKAEATVVIKARNVITDTIQKLY